MTTTITRYDEFRADKYSSDDLKDMLAKGHAMKNASGDPSYPIADEEDLDKAINAVGRGNADHDDIRKHIIDRANDLGLSSKIPENWNADGSLKDADEAKKAPMTAAERRDASLSFGDIQSRVYEALLGTLQTFSDGYPDFWVEDLGPDWVVFQSYSPSSAGPAGLYRVGYTLDDAGTVTFDGQAVRVDTVTTYVPVVQENASTPKGETRADSDCATCDGKGTIREGNMKCPDCDGDGNAPEKKSALPARSRRRPLQHQRRSLERLPEFRRVTTAFERRVQQDGDDIVLEGMPIRYDSWYGVRDIVGPFEERMNPGVATKAMQSQEFDCRFLLNHDGLPMARSVSGTLTFEDTRAGLKTFPRIDARQQAAYDLAIGVERGDITQMSVGFMVADGGDEWRLRTDGSEERDVYEFADLFDVSAVTFPASPTTSIELAQRMMAMAGSESRARIMRLFEIGGSVRSGRALSQKDGEALRAAAEDLYRVEQIGVPLTVRLDALTHANEVLFGAYRAGKVLSSDNQADIEAALEALHSCDDIDIPEITKALETIDKALDDGQAALSSVLGRATPDGDKGDLEPTLVPASDPAADKDARTRQRQRLQLLDVA